MTEFWRDHSMQGKWKDGKGHLVLSLVNYYNREWIDLRIMNQERPEGENKYTRFGVRLTLQQAEQIIPALQEAILKGKEEREKNERKGE